MELFIVYTKLETSDYQDMGGEISSEYVDHCEVFRDDDEGAFKRFQELSNQGISRITLTK